MISYRKVNLIPVRQRIDELLLIYWRDQGKYNFVSNLLGNVLIFIPLPFVLQVMWPRLDFKKLFFFSVCTSISIEILQFIFEKGIADIDDVILNSIGAGVGIMFIKMFQKKSTLNFTKGMTENMVVQK